MQYQIKYDTLFCEFWYHVEETCKVCYHEIAVEAFQQKGGDSVDIIIAFLISVVASVAGYYICKWLDRNK